MSTIIPFEAQEYTNPFSSILDPHCIDIVTDYYNSFLHLEQLFGNLGEEEILHWIYQLPKPLYIQAFENPLLFPLGPPAIIPSCLRYNCWLDQLIEAAEYREQAAREISTPPELLNCLKYLTESAFLNLGHHLDIVTDTNLSDIKTAELTATILHRFGHWEEPVVKIEEQ